MDWKLLAAPWLLLTAGMLVDEFYFHWKRGLPRWERVGHPVDTAVMLACFAVAMIAPPTRGWLRAFAALAVLSTLLVTKDEAVHLERCEAGEARLHAALFILHPLALLSAFAAWPGASGVIVLDVEQLELLRRALGIQYALGAGFFAYQLVYWNLLCAPTPGSTTSSTIS